MKVPSGFCPETLVGLAESVLPVVIVVVVSAILLATEPHLPDGEPRASRAVKSVVSGCLDPLGAGSLSLFSGK